MFGCEHNELSMFSIGESSRLTLAIGRFASLVVGVLINPHICL